MRSDGLTRCNWVTRVHCGAARLKAERACLEGWWADGFHAPCSVGGVLAGNCSRIIFWPLSTPDRSLRVIGALFCRLRQYTLEVPCNCTIALTGDLLQLRSVEYGDSSTCVFDDAVLLERPSDTDHRGSVHTQCLGKIVLGQREFVGADPVVRAQEPTRKTLLHRMKRITDHGLKELGEQSVRVPSEEIAQFG